MGRGTYNGGGLIVHAGTGFFSHNGGAGRKRKASDGRDEPGPAPSGSICDFSPVLKPKRTSKVVIVSEMPKRTRPSKPPVPPIEKVVSLKRKAAAFLLEEQFRIASLTTELTLARRREQKLKDSIARAAAVEQRNAAKALSGAEINLEIASLQKMIPQQSSKGVPKGKRKRS